MGDEQQLRVKIVGVLNSRACLDIRFVAAGVSIMGYHYGYVCDLVAQGCVDVRFGVVDPSSGAEYDDGADVLRFRRRDLGFYATLEGRAQIVHECTHAIIDVVRKGQSVRRADNEAIAWIAQTVFTLKSGGRLSAANPDLPQVKDFVDSLTAVAERIIASGDPAPSVPPEAMSFIGGMLSTADAARARRRGLAPPVADVMSGIPWPKPAPMAPD
ncbi:hypothetical protein [Methylocella sp.]|uniref:hypothetical protein n=1 Tax=Methylocella sp. TaxID=1978226 RepID=UPI0037834F85